MGLSQSLITLRFDLNFETENSFTSDEDNFSLTI